MNQSRGAFILGASALLVAALAQGCGGSASGGPVPVEELPSRLAKVVCESLAGCCDALSFPHDLATCNAKASESFRKQFDAQDRSRIRYDGSGVDACLSVYATVLSGKCSLEQSEADGLDAACQSVFVGLVPVGGACNTTEECALPASGHVGCEFLDAGSSGEGKCVADTSSPAAALHGKQSEPCDGSCASDSCEGGFPSATGDGATTLCFASEGLYCSLQSTCQPTLADGQACDYFGCKQASYCGEGSTCVPKKPDGAGCSSSNECVAHNCIYSEDAGPVVSGKCGLLSLANADTCMGNFE